MRRSPNRALRACGTRRAIRMSQRLSWLRLIAQSISLRDRLIHGQHFKEELGDIS